MNNDKSVCVQLTRYLCCILLLVAAFPFLALAGIFSFFVEIPHIKIELGTDNLVEGVHFKLANPVSNTEEGSDTESGEEDSGNEADDEDEEGSISPRSRGRVGGLDDNYPSTPVRSRSPVSAPAAPKRKSIREELGVNSPASSPNPDVDQLGSLMKDQLILDGGVVTKVSSNPNITQDHASSCEKASESAPQPSESLPAS